MPRDDDQSLGGDQTYEGGAQPAASSDRSVGDQSTFGGGTDSSLSDIGGLAGDADLDMEIVDLSRYEVQESLGKGGRGEVLALKWADILWDEKKIRMPSPKTAHMGKLTRLVPLFPELYPVIREWFEESPEGAEHVLSGLVNGTNRSGPQVRNIGKSFSHIIRKAGFDPWSKPLQNLRSTRENELERQFPSHVVQEWIGHNRDC